MRIFLLLFFFIISNSGFSQSNFSVDFIYSFDQGFRSFQDNNDPRTEIKDENEFKKNGNRLGFNINYSPNKKISIKTGIRWVKSGYGTNAENLSYDYKFLEIPIAIRYYYGRNRLRLFTELGFGFNKYRGGNTNPVVIMRKWHKSAFVGLGIDFDYSNELAFFLQPMIRYHLSNTYRSLDEPEENLYNFGIETGVRIKF